MIKSFDNLKNRYFSSISFSENKNISLINKYFTSEYGAHTISSFYILSDYTFFLELEIKIFENIVIITNQS